MNNMHDYTVALDTATYEVKISPSSSYGYFEHKTMGDEHGGGLWFDGKELIDFDGVAFLPREVGEALARGGYVVSSDFD